MNRKYNFKQEKRKSWFNFKKIIFVLLLIIISYFFYAYQKVSELKTYIKEPNKVYALGVSFELGEVLKRKQLIKILKQYDLRETKDKKLKVGFYKENPEEKFVIYFKNKKLKIFLKNNHILFLSKNNKSVRKITLDDVFLDFLENKDFKDYLVKSSYPEKLKKMLLTVEDANFYTHYGVDFYAIYNTLYEYFFKNKKLRGASTISQQLIKNTFLTRDKTLTRKLQEIVLALMLELRFSKKDILNLYLNTVYFGQDGKRAIHGFALASQFYFNEPIENISIEKMALLVAMVKGAYAYHPISQPKNAKKRRNLVLRLWSKKQNKWVGSAIKKPLGVLKKQIKNYYTSAIELAKNEIKIDKNKTYKIVLSLDIKLQNHIREQTLKTLKKLERGKIKKLQTAIIIADKKQAKVKAILGDRYHRKYVFNRAIMAKRQIGSLIKPFIYLTALAKPEKYFLYSILKDDNFSQKYLKITKKGVDLQKYQPKNYDKKTHGNIALINALAKSYNIPAVKLGLELGIKNIIKTLQKLGLSQEVEHLPSLLLGALNLTPLEIANLYQTLMNDGQLEKLSIIDSVWVDNKKQVFKKENKIVFNSAYLYLLKYAMKNVVKQGTAKALRKSFDGLDIAGKTGSSNDFRDSWFVGIGDEYLATIWLGRDDNKPMYLSGSRGAMKLFIDVFKKQGFANLTLNNHKKIEMVKIMFKNKCVEFPSIKNQQLLSNKEKCE